MPAARSSDSDPTSISREHITEPTVWGVTQQMRLAADRAAGAASLPSQVMPHAMPGTSCACGQPWTAAAVADFVPPNKAVSFLFHTTSITKVVVKQLVCGCGTVLHYDGCGDALLNLDNINVFTHELLNRSSSQMGGASAPPFATFWRAYIEEMLCPPQPSLDKSFTFFYNKRSRFQQAWQAYIHLHAIDFSSTIGCRCAAVDVQDPAGPIGQLLSFPQKCRRCQHWMPPHPSSSALAFRTALPFAVPSQGSSCVRCCRPTRACTALRLTTCG